MRNGTYCNWKNDKTGPCVTQISNLSTALTYKNGIASTETLTSDGHTHNAAAAAKNFGATYPAGTSGWFLPSIGQWNLIVQGLASKKAGSPVTTDLQNWNHENNAYKSSNLDSVIEAVGGSGFQNGIYWSSTEINNDEVWGINFYNGWAAGLVKSTEYNTRAVLAF